MIHTLVLVQDAVGIIFLQLNNYAISKEAKEKEVLDWAEEEEKKELEELRKAAANNNPAQDPENIKWMNEQLEKYKEVYGDSFGEDVDETFDKE